MNFSKLFLSKTQFIKESGLPERYVERCCAGEYAEKFTHRSNRNNKYTTIMIDTEEFMKLHRGGDLKDYA